jgi:hypothetical protein
MDSKTNADTPPWSPAAEALRDRAVERLRTLINDHAVKFARDTEATEIEPCDVEIVLANMFADDRHQLLLK